MRFRFSLLRSAYSSCFDQSHGHSIFSLGIPLQRESSRSYKTYLAMNKLLIVASREADWDGVDIFLDCGGHRGGSVSGPTKRVIPGIDREGHPIRPRNGTRREMGLPCAAGTYVLVPVPRLTAPYHHQISSESARSHRRCRPYAARSISIGGPRGHVETPKFTLYDFCR